MALRTFTFFFFFVEGDGTCKHVLGRNCCATFFNHKCTQLFFGRCCAPLPSNFDFVVVHDVAGSHTHQLIYITIQLDVIHATADIACQTTGIQLIWGCKFSRIKTPFPFLSYAVALKQFFGVSIATLENYKWIRLPGFMK